MSNAAEESADVAPPRMSHVEALSCTGPGQTSPFAQQPDDPNRLPPQESVLPTPRRLR